jgi:predicted amidohydrolase
MSSFRIALVQPITVAPPDDEKNVAAAVEWIGRAAQAGADFAVLPESYPGPWRMPATYEPHGRIAEAAVKHRSMRSTARSSRSTTPRRAPTT